MGRLMTLATCNLQQHALDFIGNRERIIKSIITAKARGATFRCGSELEITGYSCLDHFLESDTYLHSWEQLAIIMQDESLHGILLSIGMPVMHRNNRFNCQAILLNGKLLLLRAKLWLANDGNYREMRHFIPWSRPGHVEEYYLPQMIQKLQGTTKIPIGDAVISTGDTCIGLETCEELFTPDSPHNAMSLNGVEIFANSSGSHHSLRKLQKRISLIQEASRKNGGVYLYANQQGADGDRLYFDGSALIFNNGDILAQGSSFSLNDVEVITATIDIETVRSYRFAPARGLQSLSTLVYQRIETPFCLGSVDDDFNPDIIPSKPQPLRMHVPEEEIALSAGCYLWDYLRKSGAAGWLIPLSGGIDSCATAVLVFSMCREVMKALDQGNEQVKADVQRIAGIYEPENWMPQTAQDLCSRVLHTVYMGTLKNSSSETRARAKNLSTDIGSYHIDMNIDLMVSAFEQTFTKSTGFEPKFESLGGSASEDLALQNVQSRSRMVTAYMFAQLLPTVRKRPGGGGLLVLGSANVDECLFGYLTKYDCSSADINPIGGISKTDLRNFLAWSENEFKLPVLRSFLDATPTAELRPLSDDHPAQSDEVDMGLTYVELSVLGKLRKEAKLGPFGTFQRLLHEWNDQEPREVARKVKHFYHKWAVSRHKMTVATPALHLEDYSPEDHRFDLRPFLYLPFYSSWSYKKIDEAVERLEKRRQEKVDKETKG
ncbi:NAD synthetase 1 [Ophiobolus disseminans]|uniref:Glutamine-dependent NAD(+) synthetase n=1 Tax=Ophiobolus disseminans TaxID=1469910 RepID=A0A6A7ADM4_9PLEO|nr:NAD synthetase 1 [Ophiobolus disseminans]